MLAKINQGIKFHQIGENNFVIFTNSRFDRGVNPRISIVSRYLNHEI